MPFGPGSYEGKEEAKEVLTRGIKKEKKDAGTMAKEAHEKNLMERKDKGNKGKNPFEDKNTRQNDRHQHSESQEGCYGIYL